MMSPEKDQAAVGTGFFSWDADSGQTRITGVLCDLLGTGTPEAVVRVEDWRSRLDADEVERLRAALAAAIEARRRDLSFTFRVRTAEGGAHLLSCHARIELDERGGTLGGLAGVCVDLTARTAVAAEHDRLLAAERAARRRVEQLQSLTARLSAAQTPSEVARATLDAGSRTVGAPFGVLYLVERDATGTGTLVLEHSHGYDDTALLRWRRRPLSTAMPGGDSIARRRPVLLAAREEILARYPAVRELLESTPRHASAVFPLIAADDSTAIGFISFDFDRDRTLAADEIDVLETLARLCAQALERARLFEAERAAREALALSDAASRAAAERVQLALAAGAIIGTWDWDLTSDRFKIDERFAESFGVDPALGREGIALSR